MGSAQSLDDEDDRRQLNANLELLHTYNHLMDVDSLQDTLGDEKKQA